MDSYHAFAEASGPWVSTLLGIPVLFLLCRWLGRSAPARSRATALALLAILLGSDLAMILASAPIAEIPWHLVAISYLTKMAAGWWGALSAARAPAVRPG
jgi:hypothetical protein